MKFRTPRPTQLGKPCSPHHLDSFIPSIIILWQSIIVLFLLRRIEVGMPPIESSLETVVQKNDSETIAPVQQAATNHRGIRLLKSIHYQLLMHGFVFCRLHNCEEGRLLNCNLARIHPDRLNERDFFFESVEKA